MGRHHFEADGLKTIRNRDGFADVLSQKIFGASLRMRSVNVDDPDQQFEMLTATSVDFVQRATADAWANHDQQWLQDAYATIAFVVSRHAGDHHAEFGKALCDAAKRTWDVLEGMNGHAKGLIIQGRQLLTRDGMKIHLEQPRDTTHHYRTAA